MSTPPEDRDSEQTSDWPANQPPAAGHDDGEATTVVPRAPQPGQAPVPPHVPPPATPVGYPGSPAPGWPAPLPSSGWAPGPYGPFPLAGPPVPVAAPKRSRQWLVSGAAVIAVAALASGGTWWVMRHNDSGAPTAAPSRTTSAASSTSTTTATPTPTTTAPAKPIDPGAVSGLLASVPDINTLIGATVTPLDIVREPFDVLAVKPYYCTGADLPGMKPTYSYTKPAYTGFAGQVLSHEAPGRVNVVQALATFATSADAQAFYDLQVEDWKRCTNTEVAAAGHGSSSTGVIGVPAETDGVLDVRIDGRTTTNSGPPAVCDRALTARSNVIVDVRICAADPGTMGQDLVRDLAQKVAPAS